MNFRRALFVLLVFLILASIHLYLYAQNIKLKYQNTDLKIKLAEIDSQNRSLRVELARAENLAYIEKIAKEKLGMVYPEKINYIILSKEASPMPK
ncbi:MAG: septum formation initiator family protein [Candidatus Margulisiibacteriota bacterium]